MNKLKWKEHKAPVKEEMASRMAYMYPVTIPESGSGSSMKLTTPLRRIGPANPAQSLTNLSIPIKLLQWFPFLLDMLSNSAPVHRVRYSGRSNTSSSGCCNWPFVGFLDQWIDPEEEKLLAEIHSGLLFGDPQTVRICFRWKLLVLTISMISNRNQGQKIYCLKNGNISFCQSLFTVYLHYINKKTDRPEQQHRSWSSYGWTVVYQVCVHQM